MVSRWSLSGRSTVRISKRANAFGAHQLQRQSPTPRTGRALPDQPMPRLSFKHRKAPFTHALRLRFTQACHVST